MQDLGRGSVDRPKVPRGGTEIMDTRKIPKAPNHSRQPLAGAPRAIHIKEPHPSLGFQAKGITP